MRQLIPFILFVVSLSACQKSVLTVQPSSYRVTKEAPKVSLAVWYHLDLREPLNTPYFRPGFELPRLLIEGLLTGQVKAYANESLSKPLYSDGVSRWFGEENLGDIEICSLHKIALKRDIIYDPQKMMWERSFANVLSLYKEEKPRLEHSVIALFPPANHEHKKPIYFSFYEVSKNVLAAHPRSVYYNPYNPAQAMNFFDALQFRLYNGKISKYEHPERGHYVKVKNKKDVEDLKNIYADLPHFTRGLIYYETFHWRNAHIAYLNSKG